MTPLQLEAQYHNLKVVLNDLKVTQVDVRRYQNNDDKLKENLHLGNKEAWAKKDVLVGRMKSEAAKMTANAQAKAKGKPVTGGPTSSEGDALLQMAGAMSHLSIPEIVLQWKVPMVAVHTGKGSLEEIEVCLHFIAVYGLYDTKKFGTDSASGVRDYCDKYVGLDCNGFVGNFAREIGLKKEPNTIIPEYAPKNQRRTKIEDVQPNDVLVWTDFGHIAIIDSIAAPATDAKANVTRDCVVVESTAGNPSGGTGTAHGGLQHSTYSIVSVKGDQFHVERPKGKGRNPVFIAPLS